MHSCPPLEINPILANFYRFSSKDRDCVNCEPVWTKILSWKDVTLKCQTVKLNTMFSWCKDLRVEWEENVQICRDKKKLTEHRENAKKLWLLQLKTFNFCFLLVTLALYKEVYSYPFCSVVPPTSGFIDTNWVHTCQQEKWKHLS